MIQYSSDGNTLIGVDEKGREFSHNKTESAWFSSMLVTLDEQQQAARDNAAAALDYNQKLGNIQGPLNAGQGPAVYIVPATPLQKIVSDTGAVTYAPFDPPLADLVIPKTTPSQVNTVGMSLSEYDMVLRMYQKMFPDA
jgi:hypothetical protein